MKHHHTRDSFAGTSTSFVMAFTFFAPLLHATAAPPVRGIPICAPTRNRRRNLQRAPRNETVPHNCPAAAATRAAARVRQAPRLRPALESQCDERPPAHEPRTARSVR